MALRVRSRSCALSARFLPPSMPAEVVAKARCKARINILSTPFRHVKNQTPTLSSSLTLLRLSMVAFKLLISLLRMSNCCLRSWTSLRWASRFAAYWASSLF